VLGLTGLTSGVAHNPILALLLTITATSEAEKTAESPRTSAGSLWSKLFCLDALFLIRGLILLPAGARLLPLTRFIRHRVGLTGLVALLRLIRLILLCHNSSPD
jgi:hypothetical protein